MSFLCLLACACWLASAFQPLVTGLTLFLLTRYIRARVLDLVADVCPLSRGVSDSVERRVPGVLLGLVRGEEREVLPPHVARELRDVLLVADA